MAIDPKQQAAIIKLISEGWSVRGTAKKLGVGPSTVQRYVNKSASQGDRDTSGITNAVERKKVIALPGPIPLDKLGPEATRALEDFSYFQQRYFGRIPTPWQAEAAIRIAGGLDTDDEEYFVANAPPGSGKTTLFTHDIAIWLTCRNRAIRGLIGSANQRAAQTHVNRIKRTLMRTTPELAPMIEKRRGQALDAEATVAMDFGRFQPLDKEMWNRDGIIVEQHTDVGAITEKEATWSAYGEDSGFLGQRYTFVVWDDLVTPKSIATVDAREKQQTHWSTIAETRLEPGGLLVLQGQRLSPDDLYRYALDLKSGEFEDEDVEYDDLGNEILEDRGDKKYKHIIFRAHYEDRCDGLGSKSPNHNPKTAKPYPEGCLLDPIRLPYKKIRMLENNPINNYRTVYQQEDVDPANVLVQNEWVYGSENFPGCLDKGRDFWELPAGVSADGMIIAASCDPSPTNYWAITLWAFDPISQYRYLIAFHRGKMEAPQFLDFNQGTGEYTGIMAEWQMKSRQAGLEIQTWIVEVNAAAKFLLQYDHVRRWQAINGVDILPHTTGKNKSDNEFGVQTLAPHYRYGRIRLPASFDAKKRVMALIDEVTKYPHGRTDDCVMAQWFFEWNLPNLTTPGGYNLTPAWRPSWVKG